MAAKKIPVVTDEIATVERDVTLGYIGRALINPDKVLQSESGGKGIEIYEDLLREDRVASELQKRKLAVIGKEWEVVPASDDAQDRKIADFVKEVLEGFSYDLSRQALLSGIVTGFKPGEIMWDYSEGQVWISEIRGRSPKRFVFGLTRKMRLLTWANMTEGEELPDRKFIIFRNPSDNASPYGDGLGRSLYWPVWFKKNGIKFWAVFLEKFGQPTPWGKYPSGTPSDKQDLLLEAIRTMQTDNAIITPDNMAVELLEAARTSSVDSYARWEEFWNDAITILLLGQTATTKGTPGKLGEETARSDIRQEIVKADADLLCECQNSQLIPWLVDYNFPGVKKYPKVWIRVVEEKDLMPLAERDKILAVDIGVLMPKRYWYETYAIPEPEKGEEVFVPARPQAPGLAFGEKSGVDQTQGLHQRQIDGLKKNVTDDWRKIMTPLIEPVREMVEKSHGLEELRSRILAAYSDMEDSTLEELLANATFNADLFGRISAGNGLKPFLRPRPGEGIKS